MYNHNGYEEVPERTLNGFDQYAQERIPPGDFGKAVLSNDLAEAVGRADLQNEQALSKIVRYMYNELPMRCWGSEKAVEEWLNAQAD